MTEQNAPPQDLAAEHALLACFIARPGLLDEIDTKPSELYDVRNERVLVQMRAMRRENLTIDLVTVEGRFAGEPAQIEYVMGLTDPIATYENAEAYALRVRSKHRARALIEAAKRVIGEASKTNADIDDVADRAEAAMLACSEQRETGEPIGAQQCVIEACHALDAAAQSGGGITGTRTGIERLDALTTGLHAGDLVVLAGRPGMGKSALAGCIGTHAASNGLTVAVFSLEMPRLQWTQRQIAAEAGVDLRRIRAARLDRDQQSRYGRACGVIAGLPHFVDDAAGVTVSELRAKCRRVKSRHGLGLVIIDYLQLMRGTRNDTNREQEISEISRALKVLAKDLGVPVIALAQLNRECEKRADRRPMPSDLRDSGALEQDADMLWFIYRDEVYDKHSADRGIAEIGIGKQRHGPLGTVRTRFFEEYTRFDNLADDADSGEYRVGKMKPAEQAAMGDR